MLKIQLQDVLHIYLMLYRGVEFMYVRVQLAFSYTVFLCIPLKKQECI